MPDNQFINLEELSKTTQALLSKINEQSNLKVNKNNVKSELNEGTKIGSIEGVDFYTPEIDTSNLATQDDLSNLYNNATNYNNLINKPSLATVATSGSYNDLSDTPNIINWNHLPLLTIYNNEYSTWYVAGSAFLSRLSYLPDFGTIPLFIFLTSKLQNENRTYVTIKFQDDPQVSQKIYFYGKSKNPVNVPFYLQPGIYYAEYDTKKEYYYLYIETQAGNALTVSGHTVASDVPADAVFTDTVYDDTAISSRITTLENAGYQNSTQVNSAIATAIGNINQFEVAIVTDLPTTNIDTHTIYFKSNSSSGNNVYDEYMYINNSWELIGSTQIDLTPYALSANLATVAISGDYDDLTNKPTIPTVPINISAFTNDSGYLTSYTETDPTVPAWAKAATKPTYTAAEVGALSDSTVIPTKTSDLTNDSNFLTGSKTRPGTGGSGNVVIKPSPYNLSTDQDDGLYFGKSSDGLISYLRIGYSDDEDGIQGQLKLSNKVYSTTENYTTITPSASNNITITLPNATGTLALKSEIPSVPSWALAANKPTYTANEVGALPNTTVIPAAQVNSDWNATSGVAQILNKPTIPNVPAWALAANKPTYTANEVGALPSTYTAPVTSVNGMTGAVSLSIPAAQVQSDWNATTGMGAILNKPTIPAATTVTNTLASGTLIATINGTNIYAPAYTDADGVSY